MSAVVRVRREARAQSAVGAGPLTTALSDTEPTTGVLMLGPVRLAPGVTVREIGWDSNVFDESAEEGPKEDWVAAATPDVSVFTRLRFVRISAYAGSELTYYQDVRERTLGRLRRPRPFRLSVEPRAAVRRRRPRRKRARGPTARSTRAPIASKRKSPAAWRSTSHRTRWSTARARGASTEYENAFEDGIDLGETLTRDSDNYQAGIKTDLTPLLSVQVYRQLPGGYVHVRSDAQRHEQGAVTATFRFAAEAVVTGHRHRRLP